MWISNIQCRFFTICEKTNHGIVIIIIYVDDLIIIGNSDVDIFDLKKLLKQKFEMKDLGELRYFLGIEIIQFLKGIWLLQRQYVATPLWAKCGGEAQHLEKLEVESLPGLPNVQSSTERGKTPRIGVFLVSLERS
jgi:hypothetical protein